MIPMYTILVPLLQMLKSLYLMDTKLALIIVYIGQGMPFAVFLVVWFHSRLSQGNHGSGDDRRMLGV